jgi:hypothetical protein
MYTTCYVILWLLKYFIGDIYVLVKTRQRIRNM